MEGDKKKNMIYRYLGNSGLKVSVLSYGNYINSHQENQQVMTTQCIKQCLDYGINFFDTAELYGYGTAETLMGNAFKELKVRREDLVVSTKLFFFKDKDGINVNNTGLSRKHIIEGMRKSLKRLSLDYVDIVFAHRPDVDCPLEETCRAFSWLIDKDMAFYWGTSEWTASRITEAIEICKSKGLHPPVAEQPQYSIVERSRFEREYRDLYERFNYGTTIWSPLAGGLLSGKYNDGNIPADSRFASDWYSKTFLIPKYFGPNHKEKTIKLLNELADLAKEIGCTQAQLALAWTIANKDVSTTIMGFSRVEQIEENMKAIEVFNKWNKEIEGKCEAMMEETRPEVIIDFKIFAPFEQRRSLAVNKKE